MKKRIPILLGLILVCLACWLLITPMKSVRSFMERLDNLGYDLQLRAYIVTKNIQPNPAVAIIDIDDRSLKAEGRWPWPRSKVAELVDKLHEQGVSVIAFDIMFSEKEENMADTVLKTLEKDHLSDPTLITELEKNRSVFDNDTIFAKSLANTTSILAIGFLPRNQRQNTLPTPILQLNEAEAGQLSIMEGKGYIVSIPQLQNAAKLGGFINIFPDSDGIIRHAPVLMEYDNKVYPSLALQAVMSFLDTDIKLITPVYGDRKKLEGVQIGSVTIPTDETGQVLIPFIGKSYTFPFYSATDVLHNNLAKDALLGKIVFVGTSATGLGDLHATSIQNPFPGVEIQATLVNGVLTDDFSIKPAWTFGANLLLTFMFGIVSAFAFPYMGPRLLGLIIFFLPPFLFMTNNWFWEQTGIIISFIIPVSLVIFISLLNIIYGYLFESRRRERLKSMFGQYVPQKHIDEMLKSTTDYALQGEDRDMSVLFADIRSFTTISEGLSAKELVEMLNTFFTPMTEIIFNNQGTIDKYVGDLIMAFWGAPLKDKNHAKNAVESAIQMQMKVREMKEMLAAKGWPEISIGIGINSGEMSVGDMGSTYRRNYTVLGDAVNLSSRVEGLTKFYGVDIIVTESTQKGQEYFTFRKLDIVRVKGKKKGITIFEAICKASAASPSLITELQEYHIALDHYLAQQWDIALKQMRTLHEQFPDTKIYKLYIERIEEFMQNPPPEDWNGVYIHTSK